MLCRAVQVGMQNSTLGAVLAALHFSDPLVAAPCAVSACTHSIMGSLLASYWAGQPADPAEAAAAARKAAGMNGNGTVHSHKAVDGSGHGEGGDAVRLRPT